MVKSFASETYEFDRFHKKNEEVYKMGRKKHMVEISIGVFFGMGINATNAAILWYGSVQYKEGELTVGDISAFLLYMI